MSRQPLFSILLPTHNRADVLPFAIRSVLAQSETDFELLIVLDGCTDRTLALAGDFADDRIRWFDLPKGPGFGYANRNVALRAARGRYVAFLAHDDLWVADHLRLLRTSIEAHGVELAYSRPLWVIPRGLIAPLPYNLDDPATLAGFLQGSNGIPAACVVHRRECLDRYGYWDETLAHSADRDMWARIITGRGGERNFACVNEPTTLHFRANWRTESTTEPRLKIWKRLHDVPGAVPDALRIPFRGDETEQEAAWNAITSSPGLWTRRMREAVVATLDRRVTLHDELMLNLLARHGGPGAEEPFAPTLTDPSHLAGVLSRLRWVEQRALNTPLRRAKRRAVPAGSRRSRVWALLRAVLRRDR